jgi:hypothetical protein
MPRSRSTPLAVSNIASHMVSSSSETSSLGRRQAAILANFGPRNSRLEWVCAKNYAKFVSERRWKSPLGANASSKNDGCDCCTNKCGCSGSETEDDEHEAITPGSTVFPLPDLGGKGGYSQPAAFWDSSALNAISEVSDKELEAARTLLDLASGP